MKTHKIIPKGRKGHAFKKLQRQLPAELNFD